MDYYIHNDSAKHIMKHNATKKCVVWNPALDSALEVLFVRHKGLRKEFIPLLIAQYPQHPLTVHAINHRITTLELPKKYRRKRSFPHLIPCGVTLLPHVKERVKNEAKRRHMSAAGLMGNIIKAVIEDGLIDAILDKEG